MGGHVEARGGPALRGAGDPGGGVGVPCEGGQTREAWGREGLRLVKASVAWSSGPWCLCPARVVSNFVFGF